MYICMRVCVCVCVCVCLCVCVCVTNVRNVKCSIYHRVICLA